VRIRVLAWLFVLVDSLVASFVFVGGLILADSSPKQAAVAAICAAMVVIPYVAARALDELAREDTAPKRGA
jgi:hypothetical protein